MARSLTALRCARLVIEIWRQCLKLTVVVISKVQHAWQPLGTYWELCGLLSFGEIRFERLCELDVGNLLGMRTLYTQVA